ncbi:pur operon repressor [Alkalibacillus salilacus]|uniref:Purine operon repressor n=1 Tax=Alkalibacillus salilacus TaxID=284582 RepID=A0ABT9VBY2_9BACI|nr:pur operon repressor [Alkalibacillus salilacus]MDQ0158446.1 purine operon repressor [Alkalibacillus salilacus]
MKRSQRIAAMTHYFKENPRILVSLPFFVKTYEAAKSSISEDIDIIDDMFRQLGIGRIETVSGYSGGVKYVPDYPLEASQNFIDELIELLKDPTRILPGGYLYMSDLLGHNYYVRRIGKIFGSAFQHIEADYVVTVATKGIPIAYAVAEALNLPVVIIRRDPIVTEGSTISINYVSGSSRKIQSMALAKRHITPGSNVILVDDFMKAGGTIKGMESLMAEFDAHVKGIGVLAEAEDEDEERRVMNYTSLLKIHDVNEKTQDVKVMRGNYFDS